MCTEFLLAILYFITILTVNYFLLKLLKTYLNNILNLQKFQNIFKSFKLQDISLITFLYSLLKKNSFNIISLKNLEKIILVDSLLEKKDILILGNIYEILSNNLNKSLKENKVENYYFYLLEKQYSWKQLTLK